MFTGCSSGFLFLIRGGGGEKKTRFVYFVFCQKARKFSKLHFFFFFFLPFNLFVEDKTETFSKRTIKLRKTLHFTTISKFPNTFHASIQITRGNLLSNSFPDRLVATSTSLPPSYSFCTHSSNLVVGETLANAPPLRTY